MSPDTRPLPALIVIAGPTGVGKTALAVTIASAIQGEIVNADSRSFYRGMDIGTAKPGPGERDTVPHHLIDILDPADEMSLSLFQSLAFAAIDEILQRGHRPLLVGGTAQYLNAVVENWKIPQVAPDTVLRRRLGERVTAEGVEPLLAELRAIDPASAERTGPNPRRIIRALEIYQLTGQRMSDLQGKQPPRYRSLELELWLPREVLHARIAQRVEALVAAGLFDEVRDLLAAGVDPALPAFSSIGYREVLPFLWGETTAGETKAAIRHATNRLVRHQQTWFRKNPRMVRVDMSQPDAERRALETVERFLHGEDEGAIVGQG